MDPVRFINYEKKSQIYSESLHMEKEKQPQRKIMLLSDRFFKRFFHEKTCVFSLFDNVYPSCLRKNRKKSKIF